LFYLFVNQNPTDMNLIRKMMIAGCCIAALGSCKKDNPAPGDFIFYKVNGSFKSNDPDGYIFDENSLLIDAGPFEKNEISLFIDSLPRVRIYHFENESDPAIADYYDNDHRHFWSDSGTLVVNSYDGQHIKGTFSFRGKADDGSPAVHITEGQFSTKVDHYLSTPDSCATGDSTVGVSRHGLLTRHLARLRINIPHP